MIHKATFSRQFQVVLSPAVFSIENDSQGLSSLVSHHLSLSHPFFVSLIKITCYSFNCCVFIAVSFSHSFYIYLSSGPHFILRSQTQLKPSYSIKYNSKQHKHFLFARCHLWFLVPSCFSPSAVSVVSCFSFLARPLPSFGHPLPQHISFARNYFC